MSGLQLPLCHQSLQWIGFSRLTLGHSCALGDFPLLKWDMCAGGCQNKAAEYGSLLSAQPPGDCDTDSIELFFSSWILAQALSASYVVLKGSWSFSLSWGVKANVSMSNLWGALLGLMTMKPSKLYLHRSKSLLWLNLLHLRGSRLLLGWILLATFAAASGNQRAWLVSALWERRAAFYQQV